MDNFNFGENLRIVRQAKGISQDAVGTGLNISQTSYSKVERSSNIPDLALVERIADLLKVDPSILLSGQKIEDLIPKVSFETKVSEVMNTTMGVFFYWIISIPFINAVYDTATGFCTAWETTEETRRLVGFISGVSTIIFSYHWMRKVQKGSKLKR